MMKEKTFHTPGRDVPRILLVNPWIHDFAAYDVWAKPVGLLTLAAILRHHGITVDYLDCLDRFHPQTAPSDPFARCGRGPYHKRRIPKPGGLEDIKRHYSRYGIEPDWFRADLESLEKPDLILVTSLMTYWYPGVQETIRVIREFFPDTPLILGGIYARLCHDHALRHSGADHVFTGDGPGEILQLVEKYTGYAATSCFDPADMNTWPYPAFDLQRKIGYVPLLTSRGCPFRCDYCASGFLEPEYTARNPENVLEEIRFWYHEHHVRDFVFYDDALLVNARNHIIPLLESVIRDGLDIRFHTPNAVHIRAITAELAGLMFRAGFKTLRLGLETTAFEEENRMDRKVTEEEFFRGAAYLREAGFTPEETGAYLLAGLPGQTLEALESSILTVKQTGITPVPAYYTPIPHTPLWNQAVAASRYDIEADPVFTNNAVFPCWTPGFSWAVTTRLKQLVQA